MNFHGEPEIAVISQDLYEETNIVPNTPCFCNGRAWAVIAQNNNQNNNTDGGEYYYCLAAQQQVQTTSTTAPSPNRNNNNGAFIEICRFPAEKTTSSSEKNETNNNFILLHRNIQQRNFIFAFRKSDGVFVIADADLLRVVGNTSSNGLTDENGQPVRISCVVQDQEKHRLLVFTRSSLTNNNNSGTPTSSSSSSSPNRKNGRTVSSGTASKSKIDNSIFSIELFFTESANNKKDNTNINAKNVAIKAVECLCFQTSSNLLTAALVPETNTIVVAREGGIVELFNRKLIANFLLQHNNNNNNKDKQNAVEKQQQQEGHQDESSLLEESADETLLLSRINLNSSAANNNNNNLNNDSRSLFSNTTTPSAANDGSLISPSNNNNSGKSSNNFGDVTCFAIDNNILNQQQQQQAVDSPIRKRIFCGTSRGYVLVLHLNISLQQQQQRKKQNLSLQFRLGSKIEHVLNVSTGTSSSLSNNTKNDNNNNKDGTPTELLSTISINEDPRKIKENDSNNNNNGAAITSAVVACSTIWFSDDKGSIRIWSLETLEELGTLDSSLDHDDGDTSTTTTTTDEAQSENRGGDHSLLNNNNNHNNNNNKNSYSAQLLEYVSGGCGSSEFDFRQNIGVFRKKRSDLLGKCNFQSLTVKQGATFVTPSTFTSVINYAAQQLKNDNNPQQQQQVGTGTSAQLFASNTPRASGQSQILPLSATHFDPNSTSNINDDGSGSPSPQQNNASSPSGLPAPLPSVLPIQQQPSHPYRRSPSRVAALKFMDIANRAKLARLTGGAPSGSSSPEFAGRRGSLNGSSSLLLSGEAQQQQQQMNLELFQENFALTNFVKQLCNILTGKKTEGKQQDDSTSSASASPSKNNNMNSTTTSSAAFEQSLSLTSTNNNTNNNGGGGGTTATSGTTTVDKDSTKVIVPEKLLAQLPEAEYLESALSSVASCTSIVGQTLPIIALHPSSLSEDVATICDMTVRYFRNEAKLRRFLTSLERQMNRQQQLAAAAAAANPNSSFNTTTNNNNLALDGTAGTMNMSMSAMLNATAGGTADNLNIIWQKLSAKHDEDIQALKNKIKQLQDELMMAGGGGQVQQPPQKAIIQQHHQRSFSNERMAMLERHEQEIELLKKQHKEKEDEAELEAARLRLEVRQVRDAMQKQEQKLTQQNQQLQALLAEQQKSKALPLNSNSNKEQTAVASTSMNEQAKQQLQQQVQQLQQQVQTLLLQQQQQSPNQNNTNNNNSNNSNSGSNDTKALADKIRKLEAELLSKSSLVKHLMQLTNDNGKVIDEMRQHAAQRRDEAVELRRRIREVEDRHVFFIDASVKEIDKMLEVFTGPHSTTTSNLRSVVHLLQSLRQKLVT